MLKENPKIKEQDARNQLPHNLTHTIHTRQSRDKNYLCHQGRTREDHTWDPRVVPPGAGPGSEYDPGCR